MVENKTYLELFLEEQKTKTKKKFIFWMVVGVVLTSFIILVMFGIFKLIGLHIIGV
ncbi:MAG: hypothetical protein WC516_04870 [Patescibacteria group bacterium]|jgi:hypothetical protein